jgi:hypothetical protein
MVGSAILSQSYQEVLKVVESGWKSSRVIYKSGAGSLTSHLVLRASV